MKTKTITLCSSASFYKELLEVADRLKQSGFKVKVPFTALQMKKSGNFDRTKYKTWINNPTVDTWKRKTYLMVAHIKKVEQADSILVVNLPKNNHPGYIGGNVLIEMTIAFYLKKKIYLWDDPDPESLLYEEIIGLKPTIIHQDIGKIS